MTLESEHCTCCQVFLFNKQYTIHFSFCREVRNVDKGAEKPRHDSSCIDANFLQTKFNDA